MIESSNTASRGQLHLHKNCNDGIMATKIRKRRAVAYAANFNLLLLTFENIITNTINTIQSGSKPTKTAEQMRHHHRPGITTGTTITAAIAVAAVAFAIETATIHYPPQPPRPLPAAVVTIAISKIFRTARSSRAYPRRPDTWRAGVTTEETRQVDCQGSRQVQWAGQNQKGSILLRDPRKIARE